MPTAPSRVNVTAKLSPENNEARPINPVTCIEWLPLRRVKKKTRRSIEETPTVPSLRSLFLLAHLQSEGITWRGEGRDGVRSAAAWLVAMGSEALGED
ncbi:hypothetical protein OPV22_022332 [Ensete ventricosum]|uniref:Uncharacterized protein n=1 Tax=Ensete ventricosum TaxID=4639 RepID=A0AAV8QL02_ENSVE|nr:hypothetical protein OPV22_022332 [Ensete ventricosum]